MSTGETARANGFVRRAWPVVGSALLTAAAAGASAGPADDRIEGLVRDFKGTVVLYAKNLDTGKTIARHPDTKVRTASTIKLPILCGLEAQIAQGKVRWDERLVMRGEDKISGSGVMRDLSDGTALTVRDIATLMIVVSDNTATNLILDRIGADAVNDYLDTIGLRDTRSLRKVRGDAKQLKAPTGWSRAGTLEENKRFGLGVSTPRDMVTLLELLEQGKVVSPEASKDVISILKKQQLKDGIGRRAGDVDVASKGGALDALRSDVGIVYTKGGRVAMAITVDDMPVTDYSPDNAGNELIWEISKAILADLGAP
jgi:beta-lactamase class A